MHRGQKYSIVVGISLILMSSFFVPIARTVESQQPVSSNVSSQRIQTSQEDSTSIASCMTSGCHGSRNAEAPIWQRAGRIWFDDDPHAKAYTHLLTESSLKIAERLLHRTFTSVNDETYRVFLEQRCVSCHASAHGSRDQYLLGADCQVCHGPAKAWGDHHYSAEWRDKKEKRFDGTEMLNTENLASRAKVCTSCHVGNLKPEAVGREVDHDLMAAGHPPMHFELETYLRAYPAHWNSEQDAELFGKTVARERWEIGQLIHAQSRLELLAERAKSAATTEANGRVWPELTEYSCYGCHHSLVGPGWRQARPSRPLYDWDAWTLAGLKYAVPTAHQSELNQLVANLKAITDTQYASSNASGTQIAAENLLGFVNDRIRLRKSENAPTIDQIKSDLQVLLQEETGDKTWEAATQWYCAMIAHLASLSIDDKPKKNLSSTTTEQIQVDFLNGPVTYHPRNLDSNRAHLQELLRKTQP